MDEPKPIGYWLKHLHNLLEKQFDDTLADLGLSRRHWQIVNTLNRGKATRDELAAALAPFWTDGEPELDRLLPELGGWISTTGHTLALNDAGRAAREHTSARIDEARATVLKGLSADQYTETVRILSVMAGNVEAELRDRRNT
ncbi:MarR family transcriptional regulator [Sinosporangium siamense]|uniref:MarR family transcriptional regulator n=1 Tax=Sinosporangium siamense TaxID=1367973 RepID=A0A919RPF5_9ACTN|nr:MarR family transcriptional regulator [Sinosporangium siamense]GII97510.1 hypothetical protein Ssi02_77410 [Sinosporangium siamense]